MNNFASIEVAKLSRKDIVQMTNYANASHSGSCLSVVDILSVLYCSVVDIQQIKVKASSRDFVIMSKGHAAAALYSVLVNVGLLDRSAIEEYCDNGALLGGHVTSAVPSIELSTGSLGHGFPYGLGVALAKKRNDISGRVIVVMSDGECDEGTTWESALLANQFSLSNLLVIVDRNRLQSLRSTEETLALEPFRKKWESFGWHVMESNGHNHEELIIAFSEASHKPQIVIANTTKGKGVGYMENSVLWHYKSPNDEQLDLALKEIASS